MFIKLFVKNRIIVTATNNLWDRLDGTDKFLDIFEYPSNSHVSYGSELNIPL